MESLAYLHLALAREQPEGEQQTSKQQANEQQTSEQASVVGNIGSSWDAAGWDEIFKTLDEEEEGEIEE